MVLFNYSTKEITAKIVYYGPGLCGKTTNLQFIYDNLPATINKGKMLSLATKTDRTLFFDFLPIDLGTIRGLRTRLQLYTVPGQVFYNTTRKLVLKGADGVVFVADSQKRMADANIESFRNLEENLAEHGMKIAEMPLILQFNKRDLPDVLTLDEMNSALNRFNAPIYEAVATTGIGVHETLRAATRLVLNSLKERYAEKREERVEPSVQAAALAAMQQKRAAQAAVAAPPPPAAPARASGPADDPVFATGPATPVSVASGGEGVGLPLEDFSPLPSPGGSGPREFLDEMGAGQMPQPEVEDSPAIDLDGVTEPVLDLAEEPLTLDLADEDLPALDLADEPAAPPFGLLAEELPEEPVAIAPPDAPFELDLDADPVPLSLAPEAPPDPEPLAPAALELEEDEVPAAPGADDWMARTLKAEPLDDLLVDVAPVGEADDDPGPMDPSGLDDVLGLGSSGDLLGHETSIEAPPAPARPAMAAVAVPLAQAGGAAPAGNRAQEILVPIQLAIGDKSIRFDLRISLDLTAALAAAGPAAAAPEEPPR
jgi:hypothetical protein